MGQVPVHLPNIRTIYLQFPKEKGDLACPIAAQCKLGERRLSQSDRSTSEYLRGGEWTICRPVARTWWV